MDDRELLELAAKAAGISIVGYDGDIPCIGDSGYLRWHPLRDDGDALRLAVKLGLDVCIDKPPVIGNPQTQAIGFVCDGEELVDVIEPHNADPYSATRRAIVRAAAEIGRALKTQA